MTNFNGGVSPPPSDCRQVRKKSDLPTVFLFNYDFATRKETFALFNRKTYQRQIHFYSF
jgi:hypothetical protein